MALLNLGQAEGVDGAFGDDEGFQVGGVSGADGEQAAGAAGGEASRAVGRADLEAGEAAVAVAVGEEDAAVAVAADQRAGGGQRLRADAAADQPGRRRIRQGRVPVAAEVARGARGRAVAGADLGEGEAATEQEVDRGTVVIAIEGTEVDPVSVGAQLRDEFRLARRAQHGVRAGRGLGIADVSPVRRDALERPALERVEVDVGHPASRRVRHESPSMVMRAASCISRSTVPAMPAALGKTRSHWAKASVVVTRVERRW